MMRPSNPDREHSHGQGSFFGRRKGHKLRAYQADLIESLLPRLALEIEAHNERYYQKDAPTVSDAAYDALRQRLEAIEAKFPDLVSKDSPSQKVGAAPATCGA